MKEKPVKKEAAECGPKCTEKMLRLNSLLAQATEDSRAFINQCDREGLGMKTITDHRKRVEKFLKNLNEGESL